MSTLNKFWIFIAAMPTLYLFLVWKATANPRLILFAFSVLVFFAMGTRRFRCPHCKNPIMKRPSAANRFGYEWRLPTSGTCANCGQRL